MVCYNGWSDAGVGNVFLIELHCLQSLDCSGVSLLEPCRIIPVVLCGGVIILDTQCFVCFASDMYTYIHCDAKRANVRKLKLC